VDPIQPSAPESNRFKAAIYWSLAGLALLYALLAGLKTVTDFDLGWQMAAGRYLFQHHAIPRTELFSYTAHGVEWIYPILSSVILYLAFQLGSYTAISWLCALTCVGCIALLVYRRSPWAVALALLAVPVVVSETMPRASLFTMLLFIAFARVLLLHFEGRQPHLWPLPVLMLLWVNLHTGFVAGLALIAAYLFVELLETPFPSRRSAALTRLKRVYPWLIASALVTLCNPWGPRIFTAIQRQQSALQWQSAFLDEWQPIRLSSILHELNWRDPDSARWWLLLFGILLAAALLWRCRIGPAIVLLAAALAFLRHGRMEGPSILLICLIGGSALANLRTEKLSPANQRILSLAALSLLAVLTAIRSRDLVTNRVYLRSGDITLFGAGPSWWLPTKATAFLLENHLPANVFSSFNLSSYLVWTLGERYPDFADGRYIPFGESLFDQQRTLTAFPLDDPQWTQAATAYNINTVIFPLSRLFALGESPLLADCSSKQWTPVYLDTSAIIFQRSDAPAHLPSIDCHTQNLLPPAEPVASSGRQRAERYQSLANASAIYAMLGRFSESEDAASRAQKINTQDPTLHFVKAQAALGEQHPEQAEQELRAALDLKQTDAGWYNLALLYLSQRRLPEAVDALQHSAPLSSEDYQRYLLIAKLDLVQQQPQQALVAFTQAARTSPFATANNPAAAEFRAQLAEGQATAYALLQQPGKAIELQRKAVQQTPDNQQRCKVLAELCHSSPDPCQEP
jgi:tetratricopeptide (TPR) repeat protein